MSDIGGDRCDMVRGVFFFKQKTAYEMLRSLVGSEMCIRDSICVDLYKAIAAIRPDWHHADDKAGIMKIVMTGSCLLYTSDAADDLLCVDLGGRRIIKKKKK